MNNDLLDKIKKCRAKITEQEDFYIITLNDNGYKLYKTGDTFKLEHLYSDYVEENLDEEALIKAIKKQVGYYTYGCGFAVTGFIHPGRHDVAKRYLSEDDMTKYYEGPQQDDILHIEWDLDRDQAGTIYIETKARLNKEGLRVLKNWIDGQNSDGLGEGFEQQSFISMREGGETLAAGYIYKYSGFESTGK